MKTSKLLLAAAMCLLTIGAFAMGGAKDPKAVDLGLSIEWADADIPAGKPVPEGWRLPTMAEIKELMDCCTITTETETVKGEWGDRNEEWNVYTAQNGNSIRIRKPMGSRSAREFCIAGSDGCYMERTILNPMLDARDLKGFYTWEQLGRPSMRGPVRLVKEK